MKVFFTHPCMSGLSLYTVWCQWRQGVFELLLMFLRRLARFYSDAEELLFSDPEFLQVGRLWRELNAMSNFMDTLRTHPKKVAGQCSRPSLSSCKVPHAELFNWGWCYCCRKKCFNLEFTWVLTQFTLWSHLASGRTCCSYWLKDIYKWVTLMGFRKNPVLKLSSHLKVHLRLVTSHMLSHHCVWML